MNYELAKKLKGAGFPQVSRMGSILTKNGTPPQSEDDYAYPPTLSELIEACGKTRTFNDETYDFSLHFDESWWAGYSDQHYHETHRELESGTAPEEAVANLWLALNKKP